MHASTPERITGKVQILIILANDAGVEPAAMADLLATWVRAVELGFFGPGRIRLQGTIETQGQRISGKLECEQVPQIAFNVLLRMIQQFSVVKGRVESISFISEDGQQLAKESGVEFPILPQSLPFEVDFNDDLHADVRVEIEFRSPLAEAERDALFVALSIWDVVIEALVDQQRWGDDVEYETRLLSPAIVEHGVYGYFASFECINFIVLLALRLHQNLIVERITFE